MKYGNGPKVGAQHHFYVHYTKLPTESLQMDQFPSFKYHIEVSWTCDMNMSSYMLWNGCWGYAMALGWPVPRQKVDAPIGGFTSIRWSCHKFLGILVWSKYDFVSLHVSANFINMHKMHMNMRYNLYVSSKVITHPQAVQYINCERLGFYAVPYNAD